MYCQRCGAPFAPQAQFCPRCGAPRPTAQVAPPPSMERPGAVTLIAILQFLGAVVLAIAGIALLPMGNKVPGLGAFLLVLALLSIAAGIGLLGLKSWGRTLTIVLACLGLLVIPIGTILSILILVYLVKPGVKLLFSGRKIEELEPHELTALQSARVGTGVMVGVLLTMVLIIPFMGIIAAIAIPNLLTAIQRSKQKRTMADMRTIAVKVEEYRVEHNRLPEGATLAELRRNVGLTAPIDKDAWLTPLRYETDGNSYWLVSAGKDMKFEGPVTEYESGKTSDFDEDIVFKDGEFIRSP